MTKPINIGFTVHAPMPIDSRLQVSTFTGLNAIAIKYDHMVSHVLDEDKDYRYYANVPEWLVVSATTTIAWGSITGTLDDQTDLKNKFDQYSLSDHTHPAVGVPAHQHVETDISDLDKYTQEEVDALIAYQEKYDTGLLEGGNLSYNAGVFTISEGLGIKHVWTPSSPFAPPVLTLVEFGPFEDIIPTYLASHSASYIGVTWNGSNAAIIQKPEPFTDSERRDTIVIGVIQHQDNVSIEEVFETPAPIEDGASQLHDLMGALGHINVKGNIYSANGANQTLNKSEGELFSRGIGYKSSHKTPHTSGILNAIQVELNYSLRGGSSFASTNVVPTIWDDGTTPNAVDVGKWTIQEIYLLINGLTYVQPGQAEYDSLTDALAKANAPTVTDPYLSANGVLRAKLVVAQDATDLSDTTKARFISADSFGNVFVLSDLADYLPLAGGIMTGDIDFNDNNIVGVQSIGFKDGQAITWNPEFYTVNVPTGLGPANQVGQEIYTIVYNDTGVDIMDGKAVRITGSAGGYPSVVLAIADSHEGIAGEVLITTMPIPAGFPGVATSFGRVGDLDTTGLLFPGPVYVSATTAGELTRTEPQFPNYSYNIGGVESIHASTGVLITNIKAKINDTFINFFNGTFRESMTFTVTSDGATITGNLSPSNGHPNLTMLFSDGLTTLITSPPATIVLTAGIDTAPTTNYIYVPIDTKVLTVSTSGYPTIEHIKVAYTYLPSATNTQADGALIIHNFNDHVQDTTTNQGHLSHLARRLRLMGTHWISGCEGSSVVNDVPTPDSVSLVATGGLVAQMHDHPFDPFDTAVAGHAHVVNHSTTPFKEISDLHDLVIDGEVITNTSFSIVKWGVVNSDGEASKLMITLPRDVYPFNNPDDAVNDAFNFSDYTIPTEFKTVAFLIDRTTYTYKNNNWVVYDIEDLRGFVPNISAGGGSGGLGVTTYLGLTDTDNTYLEQGGKILAVTVGETGIEFIDLPTIEKTSDIALNDGEDGTSRYVEEVDLDLINTSNLVLGGVGSTITTKAQLATYFTFLEAEVVSFRVINNDVYAIINNTNYDTTDDAFENNTDITSIYEGGNLKGIVGFTFKDASNLTSVELLGADINIVPANNKEQFESIGSLTLFNMPSLTQTSTNFLKNQVALTDIELPLLATLGTLGSFGTYQKVSLPSLLLEESNGGLGYSFFEELDIRNCLFGDPTTNQQVFISMVSGTHIIANHVHKTSNNGGVDATLAYAISRGATVNYVGAPKVDLLAPEDIMVDPSYILPSMTQDIIIQCKDINSTTFVSFDVGTINSQGTELNKFGHLIVRVNYTSDVTEEPVVITVNNGLETVFEGAFSVINGTVNIPTTNDWTNIVNSPDTSNSGELISTANDVNQRAEWNKTISIASDFNIEFTLNISPLYSSNPNHSSIPMFTLINGTALTDYYSIVWRTTASQQYLRGSDGGTVALVLFAEYLGTEIIKLSWVGGIMSIYFDNVFVQTLPAPTEDLILEHAALNNDVKNIKYIDLDDVNAAPDYNDDYLATGDNTSRLNNDGVDGTDVYVETKDVYLLVAPSDIMVDPSYILPSMTQDIIIQCKDINSLTTVAFSAGTINNQSTELNAFGHLIVRVNYTSDATEEPVVITVNNGLETIFNGAFQVLNGTISIPTSIDWIDVNPSADVSENGALKLTSYNTLADATWDFEVDNSIVWKLNFEPVLSPLEPDPGTVTQDVLFLTNTVNGDVYRFKFTIFVGSNNIKYEVFKDAVTLVSTFMNGGIDLGAKYSVYYDGSDLWLLINASTFHLETISLVGAFTPKFNTKQLDIKGISYINLSNIAAAPDYNDDYLATGDKTSRLENDGPNGEDKYATVVGSREDLSGGTELDWDIDSPDFIDTLVADRTFTDANLPQGAKTKIITLNLTGEFIPTFPAYWKSFGGTYDGTKNNMIAIFCLNGTTSSEDVRYVINTEE